MTTPRPPPTAARGLPRPRVGRALPPRPAPPVRAPPDRGLPRALRRGRAIQAAVAAALVVLGGLAALLVVASGPPPAPPAADPGPPPLPDEVAAALLRPVADAGRIRERAPRSPPAPADALLTLPAGHAFTGWRLLCGSTSAPVAQPHGIVAPGQREVVVPLVPPTHCRVALLGPGAPTVPITAGARPVCRLEGTLLCEG